MNLQIDLLDNSLRTRPNKTRWETAIKRYRNWRFGCIESPDRQFGICLVLHWARSGSDGLEPLLTLHVDQPCILCRLVSHLIPQLQQCQGVLECCFRAPMTKSLCFQLVSKHLEAPARIWVAIQSCCLIQWWCRKSLTLCWCSLNTHLPI